MGCVFLILGRTYSYKDYVYQHCKHVKSLHCTNETQINKNKINVVVGDMDTYTVLRKYYDDILYPVYIHTPSDEVLAQGLKEVKGGRGACEGLCKTFLNEGRLYDINVLSNIEAYIINKPGPVSSYDSFIEYIESIVSDEEG